MLAGTTTKDNIMGFYQAIGVAGFIVYLASFASLQAKLLDGNGSLYAFLNVIAATLVLVSLMEAFNLASALIQISWIAIGIFGLSLKAYRKHTARKAQFPPPRLQPLN